MLTPENQPFRGIEHPQPATTGCATRSAFPAQRDAVEAGGFNGDGSGGCPTLFTHWDGTP